MRKLIQEIHNGKNIKENLKHYADIAVKTYVDYGTLEMTFSAYSLLEDEIQVLPWPGRWPLPWRRRAA